LRLSAVLLLVGDAAHGFSLSPSSSFLGRSHASRHAAASPRLCLGPRTAVSSIRKMNNNAVLGLNAQLGSFGGQQEEAEIPEISEELMLVMALQAQKKAALAPGSNVIVFGALDRLGQVVVRSITKDKRYVASVQTYEGFEKDMTWKIDNSETAFPEEAKIVYQRLPTDVKAAVLCVEGATDIDKLKGVLSAGMGIQRFILVSRGGIDLRESDWKLKMNPFLQLDRWQLLEETVKEYAETADWDYTIIRTGTLRGGPFFNTNRMFDKALEDRIFDAEMQGAVVKAGDQDGQTGRDVVGQCVVECLARPETANKVLSITSHKIFREDGVKCSVVNGLDVSSDKGERGRQVYTPNKEEWDRAFEAAFE